MVCDFIDVTFNLFESGCLAAPQLRASAKVAQVRGDSEGNFPEKELAKGPCQNGFSVLYFCSFPWGPDAHLWLMLHTNMTERSQACPASLGDPGNFPPGRAN